MDYELHRQIAALEFSDEELAEFRAALEQDLNEPVFSSKEEIAAGVRRTMLLMLMLRDIEERTAR